ncbi:MAG: MG2 domain-containing protein, partial [Myxococcales bacterium]|nr:MG2 domain-containing protein [Myxococcales bacterium]
MPSNALPRSLGTALLCALLAAAALPSQASAQGYELSLHGSGVVQAGGTLRLSGRAYEVRGAADLHPLAEARLRTELVEIRRREDPIVRAQGEFLADRQGRFTLALDVPLERMPRLELRIHLSRGHDTPRTFTHPISVSSPDRIELLSDRLRYEPGEFVHVWARAIRGASGMPLPAQPVRVAILDPRGQAVHESRAVTGPGGSISLRVPLAASALDGPYRIELRLLEAPLPVEASRSIRVARRTVERLQARIELDARAVRPGAELSGRVLVQNPSGGPVADAQITLSVEGGSQQAQTDRAGIASFSLTAPSHLAADVQSHLLEASVVHPAYGSVRLSAPFLVSRVRHRVSITAENGALVPEVQGFAYLWVQDIHGEPAPEGTELRVRGPGLAPAGAQLSVDGHGLARLSLLVPVEDVGLDRSSGVVGIPLEIEILDARGERARVLLPIARDAALRPRLERARLAPNASARVGIARRPAYRDRPVLIELLGAGGQVHAQAFLDPEETAAALPIPASVAGALTIRARPLSDEARHAPLDVAGPLSVGVGASCALLVRPEDAFGLSLSTDRSIYEIQARARVSLQVDPRPGPAWATLVARDLMAHGGEAPYALRWLDSALDEALLSPASDAASGLLLEATLAAMGQPEPRLEGS